MLKINIIPGELKREIKQAKIFKLLKRTGSFIVSCILIYAVIFVSSNQILRRYSNDIFANQASVGKNSTEYIERVKNINEQINNISKVQKNFISWSDFMLKLSELVNPQIKVNQLTIDKENNNFVLIGTAASRDSLLSLKNNLESSGYFSEINLPIQNLLKKDDISFTISAKIIKYAGN